jgi:hypothetical protein
MIFDLISLDCIICLPARLGPTRQQISPTPYLLRSRTIPSPASDAPSKPNAPGSGTTVATLAVKDVVALLPLGWFKAAAGKVQAIPEMFSVDGANVSVIVLLLLVIAPITAVVLDPLPVGLD